MGCTHLAVWSGSSLDGEMPANSRSRYLMLLWDNLRRSHISQSHLDAGRKGLTGAGHVQCPGTVNWRSIMLAQSQHPVLASEIVTRWLCGEHDALCELSERRQDSNIERSHRLASCNPHANHSQGILWVSSPSAVKWILCFCLHMCMVL